MFCVFFSVFVVVSSLSFAIYAGIASAQSTLLWPSLLTAATAGTQAGAAFFWLRGPLRVGASLGWTEIFGRWRNGGLPAMAVRVWVVSTAMLPVAFFLQTLELARARTGERVVGVGVVVLVSQVALYLGVVTGLIVSGMQNRTILLQEV